MGMTTPGATRYLIPVAGPDLKPIPLVVTPGGRTIGRHEQCDLLLPAEAEKVSRFHARFHGDQPDGWQVEDLNSRWGTYLNGTKLSPEMRAPLVEGDLIQIAPWTFRFTSAARRQAFTTADDVGRTSVHSIPAGAKFQHRDELLMVTLQTASSIHQATTEAELAKRVLEAAARGTGMQNALLLRPLDTSGGIEVVASQMSAAAQQQVSFSRSLIAAAALGNVAQISPDSPQQMGQSVVTMGISSAICVPIMLGNTPSLFLYLDSRSSGVPTAMRPHAAAFCVALGNMASLALSNLKRIEMERRQLAIDHDLKAAAIAQKWILPQRVSHIPPFTCLGESRAGQHVGGDFFDVIDLGAGKLAVALGDVTGKGIAASVLMTAAQGYLHAALLEHGDPARAVTALNRFLSPRREASRFVTLWVGVFDGPSRTLRYVDAGHGYAAMRTANSFVSLDRGHGLPIGVDSTEPYVAETVDITDATSVVIVSDGIIEQSGMHTRDDGGSELVQFQMSGVLKTLSQGDQRADDPIADLFASLIRHAGHGHLDDDATAVLVRWSRPI